MSPTVNRRELMRFCTICQMICDHPLIPVNDFNKSGSCKYVDLKQSFKELQLSAREHCLFCAFRLGIIKHSDIERLRQSETVKLSVSLFYDRGDGRLNLRFFYSYVSDGSPKLVFAMLAAERAQSDGNGSSFPAEMSRGSSSLDDSSSRHGNSSLVDCTTSSNQTFDKLRQWISKCDMDHEDCGKQMGRNPEFLPSRLVCVDNQAVRLCRKEILPWRTRYITLSHCWGGVIPFQLREENMTALENVIDQRDLPGTFQDAIEVTRRLGFSYIWIDSLCIVQDSESDWRSESSLMDQIFENADLCIAATHARNSTEGLFSDRSSVPINCTKVLQVEARWVTGEPNIWSLWDAKVFRTHVEQSRLLSRGWVVQERFLSPRIVHYAQGQIFRECSGSRACELLSGPQTVDSRHRNPKPSHASISYDIVSRYQAWARVVKDYSEAELSFPDKDKVIAIAGVARKLIRPQDYCAGLWRPLMHVHLCWRTGFTKVGKCRSGAPTWSWMPLMGPVYFPDYWGEKLPNLILCRILTVDIPLVGADRFGDMHEGASICLEAPLCRVPGNAIDEGYLGSSITVWTYTYFVSADLDVSSTEEAQDLLCMFVFAMEDVFKNNQLYALILAPTARPGVFHRRGCLRWTIAQESNHRNLQGEFVERWRDLLDLYFTSNDDIDQSMRTSDRQKDFDLPLYSITLL